MRDDAIGRDLADTLESFGISPALAEWAADVVKQVDENDLTAECSRHAGDVAYAVAKHAEFLFEAEAAKAAREREYAEMYLEIRDMGEKITEAHLAAKIESLPRYTELIEKERLALHRAKCFLGVVEALRAKKDMLVNLGADRRLEMGFEPTIRR